ncbi:hypothetical protein [Pseudobacteriovorax antillogorgiicola]|uniref:Uncharacterized protein n=1 Tax=Pseudobacteriovorax antillogorgiicola TaxID=1513793 RepID=A0A1Y6CX71_9BACT|nr:hypothetical protein [Pseudobacteriovorax antillogorgiicola]TCS43487.1 hypothetical protein EDD56_13615 [Pseudobacteriovorax antillogorgiicola]SMF81224.1 hypothetical protein SAMN06296036_13631 [Pseudobacteriovorax antillogorgiicola]
MSLATKGIDPVARRQQEDDFKILQAKARRAFAKGDPTPIPTAHVHEYYMAQMKEAWSKNFRFDSEVMVLVSTEF